MNSNNNNVIDFKQRKKQAESNREPAPVNFETPVLDMTQKREDIIEHERRKVKRTILSEFVGAYLVVPGMGLQKCAIYDISDTGISIDLEMECGQFEVGEEIAVRIYLNRQTYFPFYANIQNVRYIDDEAVHRHGCSFVSGTINGEALHHFVRFIETVSASLKTDNGDVMVSNLSK